MLRGIDRNNGIINNVLNNNVSQNIRKSVDSLMYYTTLAAQTINNHQNAIRQRNQIEHLFSTKTTLYFGDPETERWYSTIEKFVTEGIPGFTKKEYKEATRLTAGVTSLTTTLIPLVEGSVKCKNTMITKTLLIPIIKPKSTLTFSTKNGQLRQDHNQTNVYTLVSKDAVISKATTLFGRHIQIIGRTCEVSNTVNSSSTSSGNYLYENYSFVFQGELTLTETCPHKDGTISEDWTFNSTADIILPLTCSINSSRINCGAVALHPSETKQIILEHHWMTIIRRENNDESKSALNETVFIRSPEPEETTPSGWDTKLRGLKPQYWIVIGVSTLLMVFTSLSLLRICKNTGQPSINIENNQINHPSPTAPQSTAAHTGTSPIKHKPSPIKQDPEEEPPSYSASQIQRMTYDQRLQYQRSMRNKNKA